MEENIPSDFINREMSWLSFNQRVLHEAKDLRTPLLERVKFHSIFSSNLDEFFMKRVGGLKRQVMAHVSSSGIEASAPQAQLNEIRKTVLPLLSSQAKIVSEDLLPALREKGIHLISWGELSGGEEEFARNFFRRNVFPVLTPLAVDPGHPFPFISNLSTSLGILMRSPKASEEELFARIKVPVVFPSWIRVNAGMNGDYRLISLHELILKNLDSLFPGMEILGAMAFRITRNADLERDEEDAEDLLEMVTEELRERRFAQTVRLEHGPNPNPRILDVIMSELEITDADVYPLALPLEYFSMQPLAEVPKPGLRFSPWIPVVPSALADTEGSIFDAIRAQDILVHHPYESFTASVERFIRAACADPKVIAIKMTIYRIGEDSPFIPLLIRAAESGRQVVCLIELKARFDEERNILVAQALERAGVHVVYGVVGLKTHCKVALVIRKEGDLVRSYAHFGTGNYHSGTARLYTDIGLFTAKEEFTEDVVHLFHYLTGRSLQWVFRKLLIAPIDLKESFIRMIHREMTHAESGRPARIVAKMNNLEDKDICQALYRASEKGVRIDLFVRGVCCLRPGLPRKSENIRVISTIGRFLEHSRIFYFRNGAEEETAGDFFIGSADWMSRNLESRVEAVIPVEDVSLKSRCWEILQVMGSDQRSAWEMKPDGSYVQLGGENPGNLGTHEMLMRKTAQKLAPEPESD